MTDKLALFHKRDYCPACNHKHYKEIVRLDWNDPIMVDLFNYRGYPIDFIKEGAYVILECNNCSFLYQEYCPNEYLLDLIYNNYLRNRNSEHNNF